MEDHLMPFNDSKRIVHFFHSAKEAVDYAVEDLVEKGREAIRSRGIFSIALSGGQTPQSIFKELAKHHAHSLDWSKVLIFWSDERSVPPQHPDSNYYNAMQSGLQELPLKKENIFRMVAEMDIEENALAYEKLIDSKIPLGIFDFVMLGMGEDGHTASLFPETNGLYSKDRLIIPNFVPKKSTWRMTMTFDCINQARYIAIYVIGPNKKEILSKVLEGPYLPDFLPIQKIGTPSSPAHWIVSTASQ